MSGFTSEELRLLSLSDQAEDGTKKRTWTKRPKPTPTLSQEDVRVLIQQGYITQVADGCA